MDIISLHVCLIHCIVVCQCRQLLTLLSVNHIHAVMWHRHSNHQWTLSPRPCQLESTTSLTDIDNSAVPSDSVQTLLHTYFAYLW